MILDAMLLEVKQDSKSIARETNCLESCYNKIIKQGKQIHTHTHRSWVLRGS